MTKSLDEMLTDISQANEKACGDFHNHELAKKLLAVIEKLREQRDFYISEYTEDAPETMKPALIAKTDKQLVAILRGES